MNYFIPEQDITHKRAFDIFAMKQTADGTVTDTNWRFSKATFDPDGRVDQVTRAAMDNMVFAVGRTTDLPGILWTQSERDPLRFAVRSDKVDAFRALDPEGMEFIPLGTMWDRTAETFFDTPNFCVVNVLRRADGWDANEMTMTPYPFRGNQDDIFWTRTAPGYLKKENLGDLPMYQDIKTRELIINEDARAVFEDCDAPSLFFTSLKFA